MNVVTGATSRDDNGNVYMRREIRDLMENYPDQWSLYILALDSLHHADQSDPFSFYGLASIHGRPYKTWGDVPGLPEKIGKVGYCPHDNELFLGWHRPYLALFEQVVSNHVHDIAANAPAYQSQRYLTAAREFRIPYWDWAQGTKLGPVPDVFLSPTITITDLRGELLVMDNPLFSYKFHPLPTGFHGKWRKINSTIRWPASDDPFSPSQPQLFASAFKNQSNNLIAQVGIAFRSSTFSRFSSALEDAHGWIHGVIGGGYLRDSPYWGHMWPLEYSAFDPLFTLHHANVDRLFTLYTLSHPATVMLPSNISTNSNLFLPDNALIDASTPLLPFRRTPDSFWTTHECRDTAVLGYAYPETQRWKFASDESFAAHVEAVVAKLYAGRVREMAVVPVVVQQSSLFGGLLERSGGVYTDWVVETRVRGRMGRGTFRVQFELGERDVGSWMVLMPGVRRDEVERGEGKEMVGTTSLTGVLVECVNNGTLRGLNEEIVVPFLERALRWWVLDDAGKRITKLKDGAVNVTLVGTEARVPVDKSKPIEYTEIVRSYPGIIREKVDVR
ncbi:hypothetical protein COCVIDRAFT_39395 [Bipolaris victoriae FI3]|uniref:tyrosinase n=1 Tax=Bipolaris victoriae (strain FI3) TaxID=930091 RepID=W7EAK6_BIPV3|nr:hypothetical protein COCVIDRAFT_39395 [Bipolaris victoriae FI3]